MKLSCDVIRDLLPLYAENLTSPASGELVESHLEGCAECRTYLSQLRRPAQLPEEVPVRSLDRVRKKIKKRRVLTAVTAVLLLCSILACLEAALDARVYLTAEQAVVSTEVLENGDVCVNYSRLTCGISGFARETGIGQMAEGQVKQILLSKLRKDWDPTEIGAQSRTPKQSIEMPGESLWYLDPRDGTAEMLLWDGGTARPEGPVVQGNDCYGWYCLAAGLMAVLFAGLALWKRRAGRLLRYGALLSGSLCLAALAASGGQFVEYLDGYSYKFVHSWIAAIPLFLTGVCWFALNDLKKQDAE